MTLVPPLGGSARLHGCCMRQNSALDNFLSLQRVVPSAPPAWPYAACAACAAKPDRQPFAAHSLIHLFIETPMCLFPQFPQ